MPEFCSVGHAFLVTNMAKRRKSKATRRRPASSSGSARSLPAQGQLRPVSVPPEVAYARAEWVFEQHAERLARIPGVLSVDIGLRYQAHRPTGEFALRVHVARKLPRTQLGEQLIPSQIDGVVVDVIERSYALSRQDPAMGFPATPAPPGARAPWLAPEEFPEWFGTAAVAVRDVLQPEALHVVTCAHVVAGRRHVAELDKAPVAMQDANGRYIGASLPGRWYLDPALDVALVRLDGEITDFCETLPEARSIGRLTHRDIIDRIAVWKTGAQTGWSIGQVESVRSLPIPIRMPDGSIVMATHQIQIRAADGRRQFAAQGDSGAAILRSTPEGVPEWVAVLRAVDSRGFAIACHAERAAARLQVVL
ncbi:MAG: hypothetical protein KatS3mg110_3090 [Pirellulaceae bacterium]|nr:MAG: hypothetical protein KatS3mg110_3090 [Pirellulaceae bacterium]